MVHLPIGDKLHAVLDASHEPVRRLDLACLGRGKNACGRQCIHGRNRALHSRCGHARAVQQLQGLHDKLGVPDAAGAELDMQRRVAVPRYASLDGCLRPANLIQRLGDLRGIQRGAVDERPDHAEERRAQGRIPGDVAGLDESLAFQEFAPPLVVRLVTVQ